MYYVERKSKRNVRQAKLVKEASSSFLIVPRPSGETERKTIDFEPEGISLKFANLASDKDILNFATTYGLLGIGNQNMKNLKCDYCYIKEFKYHPANELEWVEEWRWHIDYVNRIYRLYEALKSEEVIEDKYLRVEKWSKNNPHSCKEDPRVEEMREDDLHVFWAHSNKPTLSLYKPFSEFGIEDEYRHHALRVIDMHIISFISDAIVVDFSSVRLDHEAAFKYPGYVATESGLPVGLSRTDQKVTNYLLAAIYYDLFRKINNLEKIDFCTVCHSPYKSKRKGSMYCSNACKQERKRHPLKKA